MDLHRWQLTLGWQNGPKIIKVTEGKSKSHSQTTTRVITI